MDNAKIISIAKLVFKVLFFGFYYLWLLKVLDFYVFPERNANAIGGSGAGWLMIGYPIMTFVIILIYLASILMYYAINTDKANKGKKMRSHLRLILYPTFTIIFGFIIFIIIIGLIRRL